MWIIFVISCFENFVKGEVESKEYVDLFLPGTFLQLEEWT